ncbi:MAG: SDR family oxidoreductase [Bacilli bacterium]|jgi:short-subunit dehydrogenase|nr:SDR family oxidoreductase [Bacilli bacterium]
MLALITGASSGIGREMAYYLAKKNYDLILVARRKNRLEEIQKKAKTMVQIVEMDLSLEQNLKDLHEKFQKAPIDLFINNAGFGLFGEFAETDLENELKMIDVNIKAYHILTKLFLKDFIERDHGHILNVASAAGFLIGPRLSTYYATKNYIAKLSLAIEEELRKKKSNVHVSVLCPGPVKTEFNQVAGGIFHIPSMNAKNVASYAICKTLQNKSLIVPGILTKLGLLLNRLIPWKFSLKITYLIEERTSK